MQSKKKLLFIVEAMGGGVFTYIVDLANELVNTYEVYIAYAIRPQTPLDYKDYFDKKIHLIKVKNFTREINIIRDVKAFLEIREIVKDINPDIVHLHSSKAGVLGRLAINGNKIPLFYTPHGYSFLMGNYGTIKRSLYRIIEIACARRNCMTICCSRGEYQEALKITSNTTYVNNGINIQELNKELSELSSYTTLRNTVYTLGRICPQKGPKLFNEIAKEMSDVNFVWIGDGELRDELTSPNITVTGWVERKEALEMASAADTFLLTSLWEGLPISLLESMYMKKTCIVSDVIGNHDVIHDGENGYVCKDKSDFIKAIRQSLIAPKEIMIKNAYLDVINKYNATVMADKYSNIYQNKLATGETVRKLT